MSRLEPETTKTFFLFHYPDIISCKWFVSFRSAMNLVDLADEHILHVCWQRAGYFFVLSANPLSLSEYIWNSLLAYGLKTSPATDYAMTQGYCVASHTCGTWLPVPHLWLPQSLQIFMTRLKQTSRIRRGHELSHTNGPHMYYHTVEVHSTVGASATSLKKETNGGYIPTAASQV